MKLPEGRAPRATAATAEILEQQRVLHELQVHQVEVETQNRGLREAQQIIEHARDRYADLYDFAPVGFVTLDRAGLIREINLAAAGKLGLERSRLLGVPFRLYVSPEDASAFREHLQKLKDPDVRVTTEVRLITKHRAAASVVLQSVPARDPENGNYVTRMAITDITALKRAEASLRQERDFRAAVLETVGTLVVVLDAAGRIVQFNRACVETTGMKLDELQGKPVWDALVPPDARAAVEAVYRRVQAGPFPAHHESRLLVKNAPHRLIAWTHTVLRNSDGTVHYIISTGLDVTDRRRVERRQQLEFEIARVLAEKRSMELAVPAVLQTITTSLGWKIGEFLELDPGGGEMRVAHVWHEPSAKLAAFVRLSRDLRLSMVDGLPGRVLQGRKPCWIADVRLHSRFQRQSAIVEAGLKALLAFPVISQDRILGVMAFLSHQVSDPDEDLLQLFTALGSQLGLFIERLVMEENLRRSEASLAQAQFIAHLGSYEIKLRPEASVRWSAEMFRILGLDPATESLAAREYISKCVHPSDRARVRAVLDGALLKGEGHDIHYRVVRPDGSVRHVHSVAKAMDDPANNGGKIIGTLADMTERWNLSQEILAISEREQRRIGYDLHDGLGQKLTAMEAKSFLLIEDLKDVADPAARGHLQKLARQMNQDLRQCITITRSLSHGLVPVNFESEGLAGALRQLAHDAVVPGTTECRFAVHGPGLNLNTETASHLYRIAQEAVNNALKHARARIIRIALLLKRGGLELQIKDDGRGLLTTAKSKQGRGLAIMRHRAQVIGASLTIKSNPRQGTRVLCHLPLENHEARP